VALEDLAAVARPALRHRVFLQFEAEADSITTDQLIDEILEHATKPAAS
jgi:MoxR-like ATPase